VTISTNVNVSGTWRKAVNLYVYSGGAWRTIQNGYVKDGGSWRLVYQRGFTFTSAIASHTQNYNLSTAAVAAGWNGTDPLLATVTVNTGIVVGSSSTGAYAFTIPSLPAGSEVTIINNGYIVGKGGVGGSGTPTHTAGAAGGPALSVAYATTINNGSGVVGGGGGGGGAGDLIPFVPDEEPGHPAGFGGGGAGYDIGANGSPGFGTAATTTTGGGAFSADPSGNQGGAGGNLGAAGAAGDSTAGGAAGAATSGNSFITWASGLANVYGALG
jgi:hypothetical protein